MNPSVVWSWLVAGLAIIAAGAHAQAANPSNSKISVQLYHQYTSGATQIINGHPRILKIIKDDTAMMDAARAYKAGTPNGKVIIRPMLNPQHFTLSDDPAGAANTWWTVCTDPSLPNPGSPDFGLIDYVEGPNEGDSCPTWGSAQEAAWFRDFWLALTPKIVAAGYKPCLASIAVGNPGGDSNNIRNLILTFAPALQQAHQYGGIWGYHAYTYYYGYDPNGIELSYSLRYRQFYQAFVGTYPDLLDMPMALTECGAEGGGGGWKVHGDQVAFTNWLTWWDQQLQQDSYILGTTLFVMGAPEWDSYDCENIAPWIAAHLQNQIIVPSPPYEPAATAGPGQVLLTWNGGYGSTSYDVKRATTSGGPYTVVATPTQPPPPQTPTDHQPPISYTDSGLNNGTTYYYVIAGRTSAGASANSVQVSATPGDGFAINCGGGDASWFGGDAYYTNGSTWETQENITTGGVPNAAPAAVYKSERAGFDNEPSFTYTFTGLRGYGQYKLRLHFAEIYFSSPGSRTFNVSINGSQVLTNYDVYASAGARNKAAVQEFTRYADIDGQFAVQFSRGSASFPKASGIEIIAAGPAPSAEVPTGLAAVAGSAQVSLFWNASTWAASYNLKRSTSSGGPYDTIVTGLKATTYTNTHLTPGVTYYYVVSAVNSAGESANSFPAFATPDTPRAKCDFDRDGDVDQADFGRFQACYTGSGFQQTDPTCVGAVLEKVDTDVDKEDFAIFQNCMLGPDVLADVSCSD